MAGGTVDVGSGDITVVGGQGGLLNVGTMLPPIQLGPLVVPTMGALATYPIPAGTQAIKLVAYNNAVSKGYPQGTVSVTGTTTGTEYVPYLAGTSLLAQDVTILEIDSASEAEITVLVAEATTAFQLGVIALLGSAAVAVANNQGDPLYTVPAYGPCSPTSFGAVLGPNGAMNVLTQPEAIFGWSIWIQSYAIGGDYWIDFEIGSGTFYPITSLHVTYTSGNAPQAWDMHDLQVPIVMPTGDVLRLYARAANPNGCWVSGTILTAPIISQY
jgi:hypothetical protein